jgi:hypothetical protein
MVLAIKGKKGTSPSSNGWDFIPNIDGWDDMLMLESNC